MSNFLAALLEGVIGVCFFGAIVAFTLVTADDTPLLETRCINAACDKTCKPGQMFRRHEGCK